MHIYEYLFTAIIIVIILLSSSTMIVTFSNPFVNISEKEQLKFAAQKLMTQIMLSPGDPPEWGSNADISAENLKSFGLAKYGETTREAYVLDPDKVLRLTLPKEDQLYISPSRVVQLLNLGYDYGFAIEFYPVLAVNINRTSYEVSVASEKDGLPIWNAKVYARMYYYDEGSGQIKGTSQINTVTGTDGKCILNFGVNSDKKILVLTVEYYGVRIMQVVNLSGGNVTRVYLLRNHLYKAPEVYGNAVEIMVNKKGGSYVIENVAFDSSKNIEPSTIAVLAVSSEDLTLLYASRLPISGTLEEARLTYSSIEGLQSFPLAYSIERSAIMCGSSYTVKLYLWRMSF
jgi:hypothetical protein